MDGHYLTAWPRVAALAPPAAFLAGLLIGWRHWGFPHVFSESLAVMVFAGVVGVLSGQLGAMFLLGFALGDFILAHPDWSRGSFGHRGIVWNLIQVRVSLLIEYGLLGMLTVQLPLLTKTLLAQFTPPAKTPPWLRFTIAVVGHLAITYVLVYFWTQTVPQLIRPVFTWLGGSPTIPAASTLQRRGQILLLFTMGASLLRVVLQIATTMIPTWGGRLDYWVARLHMVEPVEPIGARFPPWVRIAASALASTLLLAGMYSHWLDALAVGCVTLAILAARSGLLPLRFERWAAVVERVPLVSRLLLGLVMIRFLAGKILTSRTLTAAKTFRPVLVVTVLAMLLLFLLSPGLPADGKQEGGDPP